ncbi:MAG: hypothetical protein F4Z72_14295 [Gemmatimonadales bacterium]|uniref:hypothetical protein n=1 Tax=Candidatus Palauibacter irciniicola TaxID=3056733 RepID=UPI00138594A2|nr:hypothetical protein [Candidatus Palauibacter irciniicola]MYC17483.1 hypothetical protein [Gemmatimonadales bacterium]
MRHLQPKLTFALVTAGLLVLGACGGDDPMDPDHDDHAGEVEGVTLSLSGQTVASYDGDSGAWTGELEVEPGEETAHIGVQFVDHDGHAVSLDDDFYLRVDVANESIAEFEQDTPGEFGGHLHGVAEGDTELTFSLMHGAVGSGHADFVTAPLHVHVHEH